MYEVEIGKQYNHTQKKQYYNRKLRITEKLKKVRK